ncbi:MAG TPA: extracellular solute-binding protein, partial [Treponemataceae bacterium]|nr:extracellular solute-binding protein [Treponemataceae bacterium]
MKQFFGKLAAVMLVICMVLPVFAGGNKESAAPAGPVTISMAYGAGASEAGAPPADWVVPGIVSEKLGINLELSMLPSAQGDQDIAISASGAANDLPDIFMVSREVWMTLVNQGLVASVDDMYAMMPNRTKTHYTEDSRTFTTVNGKSYGLADPGSIVKNEGLLIRKDWLDKLGLKAPSTIDELFAVMKAFTFNDPDGNGKADTYGYGAFLENTGALDYGLGRRLDPIMGAFGVEGPWNLSKNAAGLNVRKPEFYDAMVFLKKMVDEKVIDPNWMSYKKDDFRAAWKQGKFGVMREQNAAFAAEANYKAFDVNFPEGEWIVIDPPKGAGGKSSVGVYSPSYRIYAVSQKAADA